MAIGRFLVHRVSIVRAGVTLGLGSEPTFDEYGMPNVTETTVASAVPASIQPKSAREVAAISQAGAAMADHTIYILPRDITTADIVVHDPDACPMTTDLPDARYQVTAVPSAAGEAHHLEVSAKLVGAPLAAIAVAAGDGS